jgi:hypothetical protein
MGGDFARLAGHWQAYASDDQIYLYSDMIIQPHAPVDCTTVKRSA